MFYMASDATSSEPTQRLFCVLGESLYDGIAKHLLPQIVVTALYDPRELLVISRLARGRDAQVEYNIQQIADLYRERICEIQPEGPYLLGGFSAGGAVAFEVAQQLRAAGKQVPLIVLFDTVAFAGLARRSRIGVQLRRLRNLLSHGPEYAVRRSWALVRSRRSGHRVGNSGKCSGTQQRPSSRMTRAELNELRMKFFRKALQAYEPRSFPGNVLLFRAQGAERVHEYVFDDSLGWRGIVSGSLEIVDLPGDHRAIVNEPGAHQAAARIRASVQRLLQVS